MADKRIGLGGFEFMRAICALSIVAYHCAHITKSTVLKRIFMTFPNGTNDFGLLNVTLFFMLSGGLIWYNYNDKLATKEDVTLFYKKRWLSIFPSFYIAYALAFVFKIITAPSTFSGKNPATFVLTLLGMDGYLHKVFNTWYLLGEWFLGALILCYIVFPLLNWFFGKHPAATIATCIVLFLGTLECPMLGQIAFRNIFSCIMSFVAGMVLLRYQNLLDKKMLVPSVLILVLFAFLPPGIEGNLQVHVVGFGYFIVLFNLGKFVMQASSRVARAVNGLSSITYEIFLVHHVIYFTLVRVCTPKNFVIWVPFFLLILALSCLFAFAVKKIKGLMLRRVQLRWPVQGG